MVWSERRVSFSRARNFLSPLVCGMDFEIVIPRTEEDSKLQECWLNRAFLARERPLRIRFTLEDIGGEECSLVIEHFLTLYFHLRRRRKMIVFLF